MFETLWNGFSIEATRSEIGKIKSIAGVTGVWPVAIIEAPPQGSSASPELFTALAMTGADIAQSELGLTGKGIKVAVMDTGIDVDHADFGGDGVARSDSPLFPSERIAYGFDFVGDDFNADPTSPTFNPVASPDPNPDDCNGHGSHVAGIVGANGLVTGVAPDVTFGAYRVFGCEGSTTADIMIAAMEAALKDDMDVLNMSIGTPYNWPQYPTAVAASRLVDRGMVVVASIGNNGANGLYSASAPGLGEKVVGTAAFDNTAVTQTAFSISPDGALVGYNPATGAPAPPQAGSLDLAAPTPATACPTFVNGHFVSPFTPGSLTGKAALVDRGACSFYWKARFAEEAGAAAVIIANNVAGPLNATVETSGGAAFTPIACPHADFPTCPAIGVPTVGILQTSGSDDTHAAHRRAGQADLDRPDPHDAERDRRSDLLVQLVRAVARSHSQARHRRARRQHLVDVPARQGQVCQHQRHVDGVAARRGRRGVVAAGEAQHRCSRCPDDPAEQR